MGQASKALESDRIILQNIPVDLASGGRRRVSGWGPGPENATLFSVCLCQVGGVLPRNSKLGRVLQVASQSSFNPGFAHRDVFRIPPATISSFPPPDRPCAGQASPILLDCWGAVFRTDRKIK